MKDVCARTGLARSTIHHYIREGVLPRPRKTGRNTALYDEDFVRRAALVRTMQAKTHLPLAEIRLMLKGMSASAIESIEPEDVAGVAGRIAESLRFSSEAPVRRAEVLRLTGMRPAELDAFAQLGVVEPRGDDYAPLDVRVLVSIARLREATAEVEGFVAREKILRAFVKNLGALARTEAQEMVRALRPLAEVDLDTFVGRTAAPLDDLVAALHRKALIRAVTELQEAEPEEGG